LGRYLKNRTIESIKNECTVDENGCWNWKKSSGGGLYINHNGIQYTPAKLTYLLSAGSIPPGTYINSTCKNICCCNPDHLVAGSHKSTGRVQPKRVSRSLNDENIPLIIDDLNEGILSNLQIAEKYKVTLIQVQILSREISKVNSTLKGTNKSE